MKHILIKDITKKVPFMDQEVEVKQLTVKGVKDLQEALKGVDKVDALNTLSTIFKLTVVGAEDMTDKDFEKFPIQPLTDLSAEILKFNGLGAQDDEGGKLGK